MDKYTYILLNIIFFTPLLFVLYKRHKKQIAKYYKLIIFACSFATCILFPLDYIAVKWHAWGYNYGKTLGLRFGGAVIEEYLFALLICFIIAVTVGILADAEEKKYPLLNIILKHQKASKR